jgi:hypothetical protein
MRPIVEQAALSRPRNPGVHGELSGRPKTRLEQTRGRIRHIPHERVRHHAKDRRDSPLHIGELFIAEPYNDVPAGSHQQPPRGDVLCEIVRFQVVLADGGSDALHGRSAQLGRTLFADEVSFASGPRLIEVVRDVGMQQVDTAWSYPWVKDVKGVAAYNLPVTQRFNDNA